MTAAFKRIGTAISAHWRGWLIITLCFFVLYYVALLLSMVWRFGNWPNYVTGYDWFGNVAVIISSTPSVSDMIPIILEEWLLEVGYMNMSFGNGISEWSLNLIPAKMLVILILGMMIATVWALQREALRSCHRLNGKALFATGVGSGFVALTGATMTWVVCCATPSWIVGLAMLGMSVALANWLEPFGFWIAILGFIALAFGIYALAREPAPATDGKPKEKNYTGYGGTLKAGG